MHLPPNLTIRQHLERAAAGVQRTEELLASDGRDTDAQLLRKTYELLIPALVQSSRLSPPWHPTTMLPIMHAVAHQEQRTAPDILALLLGMLCHDAYLGAADEILASLPRLTLGKVRVADVRAATGALQHDLVERGITERTLHCELAGNRLPAVVREAGALLGVTVHPSVIERACAVVARHDLPSTAELKLAGGHGIEVADLFTPEEHDCLLFRSIDRLFMVMPEGVALDEQRNQEKGLRVDRTAVRRANARRHAEEYELYVRIYGAAEVERFGFLHHTLYTNTLA